MYADDRKLYPIYAYLEDRGVPTVIMTGGNAGPDLSYSNPITLDRVAADFPQLKIIVSHGNWPWVSEIIHVAFRRSNVSISPDMYFYNMPGLGDYVKAADSWMSERFYFATAYPLAPITEYVDWFVQLPLKPQNMERVLYRNAAAMFNIES
jgi:predicted TIM-barrel fold metal-dependent hydrolase